MWDQKYRILWATIVCPVLRVSNEHMKVQYIKTCNEQLACEIREEYRGGGIFVSL